MDSSNTETLLDDKEEKQVTVSLRPFSVRPVQTDVLSLPDLSSRIRVILFS